MIAPNNKEGNSNALRGTNYVPLVTLKWTLYNCSQVVYFTLSSHINTTQILTPLFALTIVVRRHKRLINQQLDRYAPSLHKTQLVHKTQYDVANTANIQKSCEYKTMRSARICQPLIIQLPRYAINGTKRCWLKGQATAWEPRCIMEGATHT